MLIRSEYANNLNAKGVEVSMKRLSLITILTIALLISGAAAREKRYSLLDTSKLPPNIMQQLLSEGQLLMVKEDAQGKLELITAGILINKSPQEVFDVIKDYEHYNEFMPSVVKTEVIYRSVDGKVEHVKHHIKFKFSILSYTVVYTLKTQLEPPYELKWDLLEGDISSTYGSWELIPLDGGKRTAAFYSVYSDIRSINWIVRKFIEATPGMEIAINASTCVLVLKSVKARAELGSSYRLQNESAEETKQ